MCLGVIKFSIIFNLIRINLVDSSALLVKNDYESQVFYTSGLISDYNRKNLEMNDVALLSFGERSDLFEHSPKFLVKVND